MTDDESRDGQGERNGDRQGSATPRSADAGDEDTLLAVENLKKYYFERDTLLDRLLRREPRSVKAVDGLSFEVRRGETLGLVGESGCGKSTTGETLLRLRDATDGAVKFDGERVFDLSGEELMRFRKRAGIVFQDPYSSLDPRMTVGQVIAEPLVVHGEPADVTDKTEARRERVDELLDRVGLSSSQRDRYPHEFSGGQRQRIGIARALALSPDFLVLDEPVSALDVSVQAQILNLLGDLQEEFGLTYLFIAHDLSVVRHLCDRVAVMYLGEIVETGPTGELFEEPRHPYTQALLESVPRASTAEQEREIDPLAGDVPSPRNPPSGCRFRTRCPAVIPTDGVEIAQETYREVMDLRERIESNELNAARARELATEDEETGTGEESETEGPTTELAERVRAGLFETSIEGENRAVVTRALEHLVEGDREEAIELLEDRFESVCERQQPVLGSDPHPAACHLYDQPTAEGAERGTTTGTDESGSATADDD